MVLHKAKEALAKRMKTALPPPLVVDATGAKLMKYGKQPVVLERDQQQKHVEIKSPTKAKAARKLTNFGKKSNAAEEVTESTSPAKTEE